LLNSTKHGSELLSRWPSPEAIVHSGPTSLALDQLQLAQQSQVLRRRRHIAPDRSRQIADDQLPNLKRSNDPQPRWLTENFLHAIHAVLAWS
jgi:hypothetical protein